MYEGWIENTSGGKVVNGNPQMIKGSGIAGAVFGCLGEETLKEM